MGRLASRFLSALARALPAARACAMVACATVACAPAGPATNGGGLVDAIDERCPIEPDALALVDEGEVPLVLTSTHAGETVPLGCSDGDTVVRAIEGRTCDPARHDACVSGPCRAGSGDGGARLLTFALVEELAKCLGGRPHLALAETSRALVDMNRDAHDPAGATCALDDEAVLPYWQAYHRGIESVVALATAQAEERGAHALLVDLHTYVSLPNAPPPAVMIGAGTPFGTTLPVLAVDDPSLSLVFGTEGLRARMLETLAPIAASASKKSTQLAVLPTSKDASLDGLFAGRYVVHRYARVVPGETQSAGPTIDALQIEVSSGLREEGLATAEAIARALCDSFGARIGAPGAKGQRPAGGRRE